MTAGQRKTVTVLLIWAALQVVGGLGLLGWEFYSLTLNDNATITETVHVMWAAQPWAFLLTGVVVTGIIAFLAGHFFAAPSGHYDEVRRRGFVVLFLAALASVAATCGGLSVGPPGTQGCHADQYPVTYPGGSVACIQVGSSPPASIIPEVSPEPSSTPEPRPSPVPPSPSAHPPPSPESSPSPVATPSPEAEPTPTPKPCKVDADKLPCWTVRNRLANDMRPGADTGWTEIGNNFFKGVRGNVEFYVACEGRNPFARCWRAHGDGRPAPELHQPDHGTIFGTWYPQGLYDEEKNPGGHPDHVGGGVCLQSYLDSLCPSAPPATPPPSDEPPPSSPPPVGGSCGPLVRIGGGLHNCQIKGVPVKCKNADGSVAVQPAGGKVTADTTGHWRNGGPGSCDEDRDRSSPWCNGRICDDPVRGMVFRVLRGDSPCHKTGSHQYTCGPLVRGSHAIEACPDPGWSDEAGVRVDVSGTTCAVIEWEVQ